MILDEKTVIETTSRLMVELWGTDEEKIHGGAFLGQDLGVDSLDLIELVLKIEEALNLDIPDDAVDGRFTDVQVEDVYSAVRTAIKARRAA